MFKRNFYLLQFYPYRNTGEFLNVGVILQEGQEVGFKLLTPDHMDFLSGYDPFCNPVVLERSLTTLQENIHSLESRQLLNYFIHSCRNLLETSEEIPCRETLSFQEHLDSLYQEYIGIKFDRVNQIQLGAVRFNPNFCLGRIG